MIATTRFGYFYYDNEDRGLPAASGTSYRDTNYPYSTGNAPALAGTKALDGTVLPSSFVNSTGWTNIGANSQTAYDIFKRYSFNQDVAFFKTFLGTHNVKIGYGFNHGLNNTFSGVSIPRMFTSRTMFRTLRKPPTGRPAARLLSPRT